VRRCTSRPSGRVGAFGAQTEAPLSRRTNVNTLAKVLLTIFVIWLAIGLLSFLIKGLFWLVVIGGIVFLVSAVFGGFRRSKSHARW
jgi:uncharacterized membrane protein